MSVLKKRQESIKKFAEDSPCLCFNIRKASRIITQYYDEMLKSLGLTATQASVLGCLRKIGPMMVSELSEAMATDRTTLTRNLKPLERDGLICTQVGQDRRSRAITLTEKGEAVSIKSFETFSGFQKKLYATLGKEKVEKLCKDLCGALEEIQKF